MYFGLLKKTQMFSYRFPNVISNEKYDFIGGMKKQYLKLLIYFPHNR